MGKETQPFVLTEYVTVDKLVKGYGVTGGVTSLPAEEQQRYNDYVEQANLAVSAFLYKWSDKLPLSTTTAEFSYSQGMALKYAKRLKQFDDGSRNSVNFDKLFLEDKEAIASVLKAKPARVNTRRLISNGYGSVFPPYSQVYGQRGLFDNPNGTS